MSFSSVKTVLDIREKIYKDYRTKEEIGKNEKIKNNLLMSYKRCDTDLKEK